MAVGCKQPLINLQSKLYILHFLFMRDGIMDKWADGQMDGQTNKRMIRLLQQYRRMHLADLSGRGHKIQIWKANNTCSNIITPSVYIWIWHQNTFCYLYTFLYMYNYLMSMMVLISAHIYIVLEDQILHIIHHWNTIRPMLMVEGVWFYLT